MFSPLCLSVVLSTEVDRAKVLPRLDEHRLALRGGQVEAEALPAEQRPRAGRCAERVDVVVRQEREQEALAVEPVDGVRRVVRRPSKTWPCRRDRP